MDNFDYHLDHFGCNCPECNRDNFLPVAGLIAANAGGIGSAIGSLFGGTPEDKSDKGYQAYASSGQAPSYYPPVSFLYEVMPSMGLGGYTQYLSSYDQNSGTFRQGDWIIKVTSNNPFTLRFFKGATEGSSFTSSKNYVPTVQQAVQAVKTGAVDLSSSASSSIADKTGITMNSNSLLYVALAIGALLAVYFIAKK